MYNSVKLLIGALILMAACGTLEDSSPQPVEPATNTPPSIPPNEPTPEESLVKTIYSIPYADDSRLQELDVYLPGSGDGPFPTFIGIHGGAFYARSKALYGRMGRYFAERGYAFVAINFRLAPKDSYPTIVEDCFCALAWLHANSEEYGFDTKRIVVTGGSSGGYLASMLATVDDPGRYLRNCPYEYPSEDAIRAAVIFYGFYDFRHATDDFPKYTVSGPLANYWGAAFEDISTERLEEMSPIMQVDGSEPPFLILHGLADTEVPSYLSERFADALAGAGVDVELVLMEDAKHAFEIQSLTGEEMTLALQKIEAFLERVLSP